MILLLALILILLIGGGIWGWPLLAGAIGISSITDKPGALKNIAQLMKTYDITLSEVEAAALESVSATVAPPRQKKSVIAKTLFIYLGAIFIFSGISTYIGMFWDSMGSAMRILVTLGVGYILFIVLISALHESKFPKLILPLALLSVVMMTSGWFVFIYELFPAGDNWRATVLFVFATMALHQGILFVQYQRTVLAFTALFFVYGFMHVGLDMLAVPIEYIAIVLGASLFLVGSALEKTAQRILAEPALLIGNCWLNSGVFSCIALFTSANWASLITGGCVMMAAYGLQKAGRYYRLVALGYFIGSIMAYTGLFDLLYSTSFEILYLAVSASALYACLVLQSRALLLTSVIAMLSFIGYYSAEYFANTLGWPITLILMGITFIGVGTVAIKVKQRI